MRDTILTCPVCFRKYELDRYFLKHLLDKHNLKQCESCQEYINMKTGIHTCEEAIFSCESVDTYVTSGEVLYEEISAHDGETPDFLVEDDNGHEQSTNVMLGNHLLISHNITFHEEDATMEVNANETLSPESVDMP
ncbi:uncharacterized protein LOC117171989 isoform X1 [Belonocnema kinseyi]|uniref:uncharacterized protein LOC117171989 isoform X1 n=1 Tax=Belonocnema kinseyi TaxID=2817044 RepID=UPI00143CD3E7|nr:uncharacterized protein LOC117171989 isoform X1 [Belonocnema kinseyi]